MTRKKSGAPTASLPDLQNLAGYAAQLPADQAAEGVTQALAQASPAGEEGPSGVKAYKAWLVKLAADVIPAQRELYQTPADLAPIVIAEAAAAGIDPRVVWGAMWRESKWRPVGVTKVPDVVNVPGKKDKISTAVGVSQVTRTRYRGEVKALGGPPQHWHLLFPPVAIRYTARSYARGQAENGPAVVNTATGPRFAPWLGAWWAGSPGDGADRKQGDIEAHGPTLADYAPLT